MLKFFEKCTRRVPGLQTWAGCQRAVSSGRRDFYQRINEQHLAHELKNLSAEAAGESLDTRPFDPKVLFKPARKTQASTWQLGAYGAKRGDDKSSNPRDSDFGTSRPRRPWLQYESLRGETYPAHEGGPKWQDLTHSEAQRLQELYMRKKMLNRKILWLKMQRLPNPQKEAKMELRAQEHRDSVAGDQMYPPPFVDQPREERKMKRMQERTKHDELESRFRSRIREQKLQNAKIIKANVPDVGSLVMDPIKRHVQKRLVRQRVKIHAGLEEVLTRNSAQILFEFLKGVAISIVRVRAKRPRQTQELLYNLTSDHDPEWVQRQLDILAPKLRSQLALNVNMGMTPNIRFVPAVARQLTRKGHLAGLARQIDHQV